VIKGGGKIRSITGFMSYILLGYSLSSTMEIGGGWLSGYASKPGTTHQQLPALIRRSWVQFLHKPPGSFSGYCMSAEPHITA